MSKFRGSTSARYLWHPRVHERYHEHCHFYLITGEDPDRTDTFTTAIRDLLFQLDIESQTIHVLYGPYDALLRVWATDAARQRFLRGLKRSKLQVADILEFTADAVVYDLPFALDSIEEKAIEDNTHRIEAVVRAEHLDRWLDSDMEALSQLQKAGLLQLLTPEPGEKFYVFLSERTPRRVQLPHDVSDRLIESAKRAGARAVTLYSGVGFCDFILKGVAPSYSDVLPIVNQIRKAGKDLRLQPWSLVVADHGSVDVGETIDQVRSNLPSALEDLLASLDHSDSLIRREVDSLPRREKDALASIYSETRETLDFDELDRFVDIIRHSLTENRKGLNQSLSFLTSIEGDIRFVLPRLLAGIVGPEWMRELKQRAKERQRKKELSVDENEESGWLNSDTSTNAWSLMELLAALSVASQEWPSVTKELDQHLPHEWRASIRALVRLRNDFAHSKLLEASGFREFSGGWGETLRNLALAIQFQLGMEELRRIIREAQ